MSASTRLELLTVSLTAYTVVGCGHVVWLQDDHVAKIKKTKKSFYCSRCGRSNYFPGQTEEQRLRAQLKHEIKLKEWAQQEAKDAERRRRAEKAAKTRIKNRVAKGVCPCCNRTFQDLQRHMATKHPDFTSVDEQPK